MSSKPTLPVTSTEENITKLVDNDSKPIEARVPHIEKKKKEKAPNSRQRLLAKILSIKKKESPTAAVHRTIVFADRTVEKNYRDYSSQFNNFSNLIKAIQTDPFGKNDSLGRPELLKGNYAGHWSRRISLEHRIVYTVLPDGNIKICEVGEHYQKSKK